MTEPANRPVPVASPPRSRLRDLLVRVAPGWFSPPVPRVTSEAASVQADISRVQREERPLARTFFRLLAFAATAAAVAWWFRAFYGGPMLSRPVFSVGAFVWLAAGALAHLGLRRSQRVRDIVEERRGPRFDYVLSWIGLLWAALALL